MALTLTLTLTLPIASPLPSIPIVSERSPGLPQHGVQYQPIPTLTQSHEPPWHTCRTVAKGAPCASGAAPADLTMRPGGNKRDGVQKYQLSLSVQNDRINSQVGQATKKRKTVYRTLRSRSQIKHNPSEETELSPSFP